MRFYFLFLGLLISYSTLAQSADTTRRRVGYQETMPVFPGGPKALFKLVTDSLRYPPTALRDGIQGKVLLAFVVDSTGHVTNITIKQGLRPDLDAEALRAAQRLQAVQWQPGTQNRRPVNVFFTVPVTFSIDNISAGMPADSLDLFPGPALVLPSRSWSTNQGEIPAGKGVIYGHCLQRLGFSSGGLPQYVRLLNLTTGKFYRISVKPIVRTRPENEFCVALPPGRYVLQWYEYSYGTEALRKAARGALTDRRYSFTLQPGQLQYVGKWDFAQPNAPRFLSEKAVLDARLGTEDQKLYQEAFTTIPH
ncbi:energy transducer TonB [Hymenobacter lutimineralis]|uniref:Energy transducer TonB n=1 Tax=Hymenobacter lutimineralis TaxID=2606448 RepID=A0A5D6UV10_9BACT|nr:MULTISPECIES: energy transducer TonB [Hymenobacter]TYZ07571.1 energy transducer TonB [Hymenobacter lutimineralis]